MKKNFFIQTIFLLLSIAITILLKPQIVDELFKNIMFAGINFIVAFFIIIYCFIISYISLNIFYNLIIFLYKFTKNLIINVNKAEKISQNNIDKENDFYKKQNLICIVLSIITSINYFFINTQIIITDAKEIHFPLSIYVITFIFISIVYILSYILLKINYRIINFFYKSDNPITKLENKYSIKIMYKNYKKYDTLFIITIIISNILFFSYIFLEINHIQNTLKWDGIHNYLIMMFFYLIMATIIFFIGIIIFNTLYITYYIFKFFIKISINKVLNYKNLYKNEKIQTIIDKINFPTNDINQNKFIIKIKNYLIVLENSIPKENKKYVIFYIFNFLSLITFIFLVIYKYHI